MAYLIIRTTATSNAEVSCNKELGKQGEQSRQTMQMNTEARLLHAMRRRRELAPGVLTCIWKLFKLLRAKQYLTSLSGF